MFLKLRLSKQILPQAFYKDLFRCRISGDHQRGSILLMYFTHDKQDTRPGLSSLPVNSHGRNGGNTKSCTSVFKDEIVPLTEKEIENLTISALKDELGKRKLSKKGNKQILVSRLKSSLQSTSQKTSAVSDQTDIPPLCTVRDEISYPRTAHACPFC